MKITELILYMKACCNNEVQLWVEVSERLFRSCERLQFTVHERHLYNNSRFN